MDRRPACHPWSADVVEVPPSADHDVLAEAVLDGVEDGTVLVGHSLGGAVALGTAARDASRIGGVIVVAAGWPMRVHPALWTTLDRAGVAGAARQMAVAASGGRHGRAATGTDRLEGMLTRAGTATLRLHLEACDRFEVPAPPDVPVVELLAGDQDRLVPPRRHAAALADAVGARLTVLEGVGHQIP